MYLDTANIDEIKKALSFGIIEGITTNPTLIKKENIEREQVIKTIFGLGVEHIFVQLIGETSEELYKDYLKLEKIETEIKKDIYVKIPITTEGVKVIKKIKEVKKNKIILGTAIYSVDQAIIASIAGCNFIAPYINRMENNSIDAINEIYKIRKFIDNQLLNTKIMAASFKNTAQISNSLINGAHICTIPYDMLIQMMDKQLAVEAVKVFNKDGVE